jgi:ribonuclease P protein component
MKHLSVKENHLFSKAYAGGLKFSGRYTAVYVLRDKAAKRLMNANPEKKYLNRLGISVTKKLGGAVVRSRVRRIIREGFRALERECALKTGYIIIISARAAAVGMKSTDIYRELKVAFGRLGMYAGENQE